MEEAKNSATIFSTYIENKLKNETREPGANVTTAYNFFLKASSVNHARNKDTIFTIVKVFQKMFLNVSYNFSRVETSYRYFNNGIDKSIVLALLNDIDNISKIEELQN